MSDKNYPEQINEIIQKMTAEKTFSADVMAHFLGLKTIADGQAELLIEQKKRIAEQEKDEGKLVEERDNLKVLLEKADEAVVRYTKAAREVRKTKRNLKVTLLKTQLEAEQSKTAYVQECLRIMFKNPVYQEAFSKSISDSKNGYQNSKTETSTKDKKVQE